MLNNDFKDLVIQYQLYKKQEKSARTLRALLAIMIALLLAGVLYYFFMQPQASVTQKDKNSTTHSVTKKETSPLSNALEPTKKEQNQTEAINTDTLNTHRFQVTTQEHSLEQLLKNQKKQQNYSSTIALANYHYSKKAYDKAIDWAIKASQKNKSEIRPWIIYAKSKQAQGKVEFAKKALKLYLEKHSSKEIQDLLDSMK